MTTIKSLFILSFIFLLGVTQAQEKFTISGTIKDAENGEDIIGANVAVKELPGTGTVTNIYGFYSLTLPKGEYTLIYRFIGYQDQEFPITLDQNIKKDLELGVTSTSLTTVVVTGEKEDQNITDVEMGVTRIDMKEAEAIPVLFGEKDIMKTLQLTPGVKSAGEGNAGFFVRGGAADQNLILLDGAPVYNASHLLGFFSVFNSDALKDVKLYKGSMPAEFGGRLSSVMDIKMKDGNSKRMAVSGGVGLISSKLTIESPIVKDKGSFIISGRRTYADMFLKLSKDEQLNQSILYFYDLNAKANYQINDNNRIFLSGYFGRDNFGFGDQFGFDWGNATGTLRWNHIYNDRLFSNTSVIFSNYNYKIAFGDGDFSAEIGSDIQDINLKQDFDYYLNDKNTIKFGANIIHHTFKPGSLISSSDGPFNDFELDNKYSLESALYISNEQKISDRLTLNYGLRYSNFTQLGPGDIFSFNADGEVTDTTTYGDWETVSSYNGLAPRLSGNYIINEMSSFKAAYARSYQYLHLLSNSTSSTPTDIWMPSSNNIAPELADQVSLGYFRNFSKNKYEFSSEIYYKTMQNSIDYKTGAEVTLNPTVEGELLFGEGRAYGLELYLKKRTGKFTGWISYTLSRSERKFEDINQNNWYPAKQDRTHDVSVVGIYSITDRIKASASWVYYTGNAVTFPSGKYEMDGQTIYLYTERNGYRMPDYHRLDLGVTIENKGYKVVVNQETGDSEQIAKRFQSSWNFSVYNAYGRENAYSISFRDSEANPGQTEAVQLSLFKAIPSISYNFKF